MPFHSAQVGGTTGLSLILILLKILTKIKPTKHTERFAIPGGWFSPLSKDSLTACDVTNSGEQEQEMEKYVQLLPMKLWIILLRNENCIINEQIDSVQLCP